jgi:hypothetical protein
MINMINWRAYDMKCTVFLYAQTDKLFVIYVRMLFLAYVTVRLAPSTEMMGLLPRGEGAVVGGVLAAP